jgi:dynactin-4
MAQAFPYTYYACDCFDSNSLTAANPTSHEPTATDDEEETLDPRNPRSNFALYPLEHLLYCEDCLQIRCPRCVIEETLNWYCPNCLFEVPSSVVKSDGNRCTRNCFNCPVCISPMIVNLLENPDVDHGATDRHVLACPYCHWSTVETGIEFEKHTGVYSQIARIANGGKPIPSSKERDKERERRKELEAQRRDSRNPHASSRTSAIVYAGGYEPPSRDDLFANLAAFYKSELDAQTPSNPLEMNFSSPTAYSRIMNLYSTSTKKSKRSKPTPMRDAASELEGLVTHDPASENAAIERIKRGGWSTTLSPAQKRAQLDPYVQSEDELRPIPTLLCTKRSKRCRSCRHILAKPESKITSTRYKIKLLALNHIPRLTIRALSPPTNPPVPAFPGAVPTPQQQPQLPPLPPPPPFNYTALRPGIPAHFLLHLSNPLFDPIRVTLATSSTTPGRVASRVTILCPEFEVGANTDVWDDALSSSPAPMPRRSTINAETGQIEAGKIWDKGRNWTSVAIEVIPGFLDEVVGGDEELDPDDDLLEIPIFVRLEFEADVNAEERGLGDSRGNKGEREKREEAFWTVVGVGRIANS